jgi:O-antigen/teichoic acid export membrane protein
MWNLRMARKPSTRLPREKTDGYTGGGGAVREAGADGRADMEDAVEVEVLAEAETDAAPGRNLHRAAVGGAFWVVAGYGAMQVLRFGFNIILTRLLAPDLFGLMALVHVFVQGLHMFSDIGLRQGIVQSPRGEEPAFLQTAWTLQVGRGILLWLASLGLAWPVALAYQQPDLIWLVPLVGFTTVLDGFNATAFFLLQRRLMLARLVLPELISYVVGMVVVVAWVWGLTRAGGEGLHGQELLALGCGTLVSSAVSLGLSYCLLPGLKHRLHWDRSAARELLQFGGWVTLSAACTFLAGQADRLTLGLLSLTLLGVYHLAGQLMRIPTLLIHDLSNQLVFPLASRLRDEEARQRQVYAGLHLLLIGFAGLMTTGLYAAGPTLVHAVYDQRYAEAGYFLRWLSAVAWFTMLQYPREAFLLAHGNSRQFALGKALKLAALLPLMLGGYYLFDVTGFLAGLMLVEALRYVQLLAVAGRGGLRLFSQDLALTGATVVLGLAFQEVGAALDGSVSRWGILGVQVVGVTAAWAALFGLEWWRGALPLDWLRRPAESESY